MTPRQIAAALSLAQERQAHQQAQALSIAAMGARGKPDDVQSTIKKLSRT